MLEAIKFAISNMEHSVEKFLFAKDTHISLEGELQNLGILFCYTMDIENHGYRADGNTKVYEWEARMRTFINYLVVRSHKVFEYVITLEEVLNLSKEFLGEDVFFSRELASGMTYSKEMVEKNPAYGKMNEFILSRWKNTSNHSSCWRHDGFPSFTKTFFKTRRELTEIVPETEREDWSGLGYCLMPGCNVISRHFFNYVQVEHVAEALDDSYFRKLTSIKPCKAVINACEDNKEAAVDEALFKRARNYDCFFLFSDEELKAVLHHITTGERLFKKQKNS